MWHRIKVPVVNGTTRLSVRLFLLFTWSGFKWVVVANWKRSRNSSFFRIFRRKRNTRCRSQVWHFRRCCSWQFNHTVIRWIVTIVLVSCYATRYIKRTFIIFLVIIISIGQPVVLKWMTRGGKRQLRRWHRMVQWVRTSFSTRLDRFDFFVEPLYYFSVMFVIALSVLRMWGFCSKRGYGRCWSVIQTGNIHLNGCFICVVWGESIRRLPDNASLKAWLIISAGVWKRPVVGSWIARVEPGLFEACPCKAPPCWPKPGSPAGGAGAAPGAVAPAAPAAALPTAPAWAPAGPPASRPGRFAPGPVIWRIKLELLWIMEVIWVSIWRRAVMKSKLTTFITNCWIPMMATTRFRRVSRTEVASGMRLVILEEPLMRSILNSRLTRWKQFNLLLAKRGDWSRGTRGEWLQFNFERSCREGMRMRMKLLLQLQVLLAVEVDTGTSDNQAGSQ